MISQDGSQSPYAAAVELRNGAVRVLADGMQYPATITISGVVSAASVAAAVRQGVPYCPVILVMVGTTESGVAGWDNFEPAELATELCGPAVTQGTEADALTAVIHEPDAMVVVYGETAERWYMPAPDGSYTSTLAPSFEHDISRKFAPNQAQFLTHVNASLRRIANEYPTVQHAIVWAASGFHPAIANADSRLLTFGTLPEAKLTTVKVIQSPDAVLVGALQATHLHRAHNESQQPANEPQE